MVVGQNNFQICFNKKLFTRYKFFFFLKSFLLQKIINIFSKGGKKNKSEKIVFCYFFLIKKNTSFYSPIIYLFYVLEKINCSLELILKRVARRFYQVPIPVRLHRQYTKSVRLFCVSLKSVKQRVNFVLKFYEEHNSILFEKHRSIALKKKYYVNEQAVANRMFTHYR